MSGDTKAGLWRGIDDLTADRIEACLEAEFPALHRMGMMDRRDLMRLMGASLALAGLTACEKRQPPLLSQPFSPEGHVAGKPLYFATSLPLDGYGRGVLVKSHDGRPIKIEGNPLHPASLGATDPFMQAEILSLYDPDRSRTPRRGDEPMPWSVLRRFLAEQRTEMAADGGQGAHILIGATSSPTLAGLIERLRALYPAMRFHSYSPVSDFAAPELIYRLDRADVVLSLGADFLGPGPAQVRYARDWKEARPRLIVAEPTPTLTGAQADQRLPLAPHAIEALAAELAAGRGPPDVVQALSAGRAMVLAGRDQSPAVQALAHRLNSKLGAYGNGIVALAPVRLAQPEGIEPLDALVAEMAAGQVRRLAVLDCNPAYDAPADFAFDELMTHVPVSLHLSFGHDETARVCRWHVPMRHVLESWGDIRAYDGTVGLQQPATVPLAPALSAIELLAALAGDRPDGRALVRRQWNGLAQEPWLRALEAGVISGTEAAPAAPPSPPPAPSTRPAGLTLTFQLDGRMWDGRFAGNAWLQELPSPLTKLVWGNAALIAPATAARLGLKSDDKVEIAHRGASVTAPVWVMPGQATDVVTLPLGYGRRSAGRVGTGIGVDAFRLRAAATPWAAPGVEVRKVPGQARLVSTQRHHPIADPGAIRTAEANTEDLASLYPDYPSLGHAWGMVIDTDACIGCGACTIACQAENNIPVVGPDEVERGREMHWIRVDRYHEGPVEAPETHFQPVPCMHCEKAPCEVVCPVGATVHSADGLNQMVYNRCIGTRTCSNNCPYKVRRFNWFDYQSKAPATPAPANNPRVTVRDRGVMEKCTYCVQRINAVRAEAKVEGRDIRDGDVRTACQQVCPTRAIVFGDLNDPNSEVARLRRSGRNYALLGNLGTRPRTTYLARVRRRT